MYRKGTLRKFQTVCQSARSQDRQNRLMLPRPQSRSERNGSGCRGHSLSIQGTCGAQVVTPSLDQSFAKSPMAGDCTAIGRAGGGRLRQYFDDDTSGDSQDRFEKANRRTCERFQDTLSGSYAKSSRGTKSDVSP
jgi:hypothetical protein